MQIMIIALAVAAIQTLTLISKEQYFFATAEVLFKQSPNELGLYVQEEFPTQIVPMESKMMMLTSDPVLERASASFKTDDHIELSADELRASLKIEKGSVADAARITATHPIPDRTVQIVKQIVAAYIAHDIERTTKSIREAVNYHVKRKGEIEADIQKTTIEFRETVRNEYSKKGIWDPESQSAVKVQQLVELEKFKQQTLFDLAKLRAKLEKAPEKSKQMRTMDIIERHLSPYSPISASPSAQSTYTAKLSDLNMRLKALRKKYTETHPAVMEVKTEIQTIHEAVKEENVKTAADEYDALREQKDVLEAANALIDEVLMNEWNSLSAIAEQKMHFEDKKRKIDDLQRRLLVVGDKIEDLNLMLKKKPSEKESAIEIIRDPHHGTTLPKAEKSAIPLIVLISLVIGVAGGYIIEYLNDSMRSSMDVKTYLNLSTIATIPYLKDEPTVLTDVALKSPLSELYNKLGAFLESVILEQKAKTILFTSAKAGEGKSTVSSNTAIALAQSGEKVILIDSDLRKPQYHMIFGLDNSRGLSNILSGEFEAEQQLNGIINSKPMTFESYLHATSVESLKVLTSGPVPMNPITLLKSPRMNAVIAESTKLANIVIFDSPPILGVIDAAILSTMVDLTVIVMSENEVRRAEAAQVKHAMSQVGANIIGVVLNKAGIHPETYYYYYHRYRGYS